MLREKLHIFGILGYILCVVGLTTVVLHAPQECAIESVKEVWDLATEPGFLLYASMVITAVLVLIFHFVPQYGQTHIMCYIGVCSLVSSLSVHCEVRSVPFMENLVSIYRSLDATSINTLFQAIPRDARKKLNLSPVLVKINTDDGTKKELNQVAADGNSSMV